VLSSPWISFDISSKSFTTNAYKDCIGVIAGKKWSSAFMNCPWPHTSASDYYNQAITAPESWWKDLPVENVLVLAGEDEVLVDGIMEFEKKLSAGLGGEKVEFMVAKGEYHDQPNMDLLLGYKEKDEGELAKKIKEWISIELQGRSRGK
jgi:acetyl esterase/lipase